MRDQNGTNFTVKTWYKKIMGDQNRTTFSVKKKMVQKIIGDQNRVNISVPDRKKSRESK